MWCLFMRITLAGIICSHPLAIHITFLIHHAMLNYAHTHTETDLCDLLRSPVIGSCPSLQGILSDLA